MIRTLALAFIAATAPAVVIQGTTSTLTDDEGDSGSTNSECTSAVCTNVSGECATEVDEFEKCRQ